MLLAILKAIAAIPAIYEAFDKLLGLVTDAWFQIKKSRAGEQFGKGEEIAKKEKNTCELERAFNPDKKCD